MNARTALVVILITALALVSNAYAFALVIAGSHIQLAVILNLGGNVVLLLVVAALFSKLMTGRYFPSA
jgi:hypothetical protein